MYQCFHWKSWICNSLFLSLLDAWSFLLLKCIRAVSNTKVVQWENKFHVQIVLCYASCHPQVVTRRLPITPAHLHEMLAFIYWSQLPFCLSNHPKQILSGRESKSDWPTLEEICVWLMPLDDIYCFGQGPLFVLSRTDFLTQKYIF